FCGLIGSLVFSQISDISYVKYSTNIILITLFLIACTQCVLTLLTESTIKNTVISFVFSIFFGLCYGYTLKIIKHILNGDFSHSLPSMNIFYDIGLVFLILSWLLFLFYPIIKSKKLISDKVSLYIYINSLNASQPDPKTITSSRNDYSYE
ncbi:MAG: hypothetical protein NTU49_02205, partial [Gammaproteobacteria bacterium]|nr:hypothetical protein [Gammaproteobacteria bacterium]